MKKYIAIALSNIRTALTYPQEMAGIAIFLTVQILILQKLYSVTLSMGSFVGLTVSDVIWIYYLVNISVPMQSKGVSNAINKEVLEGQLVYRLGRPYSYALFYFASFIGEIIPKLVINGTIGAAVLLLISGTPQNVTSKSILCGSLLLMMGTVLSFLFHYSIGLCSFWIEDVSPLRWIFKQAASVLGGGLIPLAFFPDNIRPLMEFLPFAHIYYGGAEMVIAFNQSKFLFYLISQIFWITVMVITSKVLFSRGTKNVVVQGG